MKIKAGKQRLQKASGQDMSSIWTSTDGQRKQENGRRGTERNRELTRALMER